MENLTHEIIFEPAWYRTDPDPKKDYGVRDVTIYFLVLGSKGIVEFQLDTGWHLPQVEDNREKWALDRWYDRKSIARGYRRIAFPADVCYWSRTQLSEDDHQMSNIIRAFSGDACFYGYKPYPAPEEAYQALVVRGEVGIWEYLENYYCEVFGC